MNKRNLTTSHQTSTQCFGERLEQRLKRKELKTSTLYLELRQLLSLRHVLEREENSLFSTLADWPQDDILGKTPTMHKRTDKQKASQRVL